MDFLVVRAGRWRWQVLKHDTALGVTTAAFPGITFWRRGRADRAAAALKTTWWDGYGLGLVAGAPGYHDDGTPDDRDPGAPF